MTGSGGQEQAVVDGGIADESPACVALVPVAQPTEWTSTVQPSRPASTFVAQLLATADHAPQTRSLRRAAAADARTAYGVNLHPRAAGMRTRQSI